MDWTDNISDRLFINILMKSWSNCNKSYSLNWFIFSLRVLPGKDILLRNIENSGSWNIRMRPGLVVVVVSLCPGLLLRLFSPKPSTLTTTSPIPLSRSTNSDWNSDHGELTWLVVRIKCFYKDVDCQLNRSDIKNINHVEFVNSENILLLLKM